MTRKPKGKDPTHGNGEDRDDLRKIQSIDRSAESTEVVVAPPSLPTDESFQQTEESLAEEVEASSLLTTERVRKSADGEVEGNRFPPAEVGAWEPFASFVVEFQMRQVEGRTEQQTIVRYREMDTIQLWCGIESEQLQRWMLDQMGEVMRSEPLAEKRTTTTPVTVEITQLRLLPLPQSGMPMVINQANQIFPNAIRSGEPLEIEVSFRLTEPVTADIAKQQVTYCIQCYARHRTKEAIVSLGDTQSSPLVEGRSSYTTMLSEATLPAGIYRLQVLVTLQGTPAPPAFVEVPLLQVI